MSNHSTQTLRHALELCRLHDKGLVRGSFIRVTETKILEWAKTNRLKLIYSENVLAAMVVLSVAASRHPVRDFSGVARSYIESGDLVIRRLACQAGYESAVVRFLFEQKHLYSRLWLRIWQEHPVDRRIVAQVGAKWMGTKVLSGGELAGIWCCGEAESQPLPVRERWVLRRLSIKLLPTQAAQSAVLRNSNNLIAHYSAQYNNRNSWSAFALRGYGGRTDFIIKPSEMSKAWKTQNRDKMEWEISDTPARWALPELEPLIDAIPGSKHRIRIMRLAAGGKITRHSDVVDKDAGTGPGKTLRIHIPICTTPHVWFTGWDLNGRRRRSHMARGEAWYLDTRKPHEVENAGNTDRIHLVMDVLSCPELLNLAKANQSSFSALGLSQFGPALEMALKASRSP